MDHRSRDFDSGRHLPVWGDGGGQRDHPYNYLSGAIAFMLGFFGTMFIMNVCRAIGWGA